MIRKNTAKWSAVALTIPFLSLTSCGNEELYYPAAGGGAAASRAATQSRPLAPPAFKSEDYYNIPGVRETHAAVDKEACQSMLERFRREGRTRLKLRTQEVGGDLPILCIFEGEDAQVGTFDDHRYGR
jgi:hypothetical protein